MLKKHMAACLLATAFAAPAFAQAPATPSTPPTSAVTTPAMPSATMSGQFITKVEPMHIMASELIGTRVISANNESIGDINDVIIDRKGQAIAAVVGVGGFLGIGEKDVAVPFSALEFATREQVSAMTDKNVMSTGSTATTGAVNAPATGTTTMGASTTANAEMERVILRMTKADLQSAPAFDSDRDAPTTGSTTGTSTTAPMNPATTPAAPAPKP